MIQRGIIIKTVHAWCILEPSNDSQAFNLFYLCMRESSASSYHTRILFPVWMHSWVCTTVLASMQEHKNMLVMWTICGLPSITIYNLLEHQTSENQIWFPSKFSTSSSMKNTTNLTKLQFNYITYTYNAKSYKPDHNFPSLFITDRLRQREKSELIGCCWVPN